MSHRYPVNWQEFYLNAQALAWRLNEGKSWKGLIAITRGGLVPATVVARELGIRKIDTISIVSYDDNDKQIEPSVIKTCQTNNQGQGWLVIDDLVDTGATARIVRDLVPQAHIAAIYAKPSGKDFVDTFMTEVSQDTWIVFPWEEEIN
ncbi:MAG: Xanthine phosphoribosyltransferase [uncultured bacterium]|nr:MAG: Xanthine phosphoribosyltransferase [uncultured bacterium]OFW68319.1 MAG: xanthine phosphoribosyltransferase [Alphaproteobacteria bacterium GWC2_42_16]OFW74793.1 MAG: xanthine phosphoribosyltransferase [Alphaproteobacteria bacterium GWA2_41_27]OFW85162.1 MAG: xanthine phosphoribosyltransferase [Alphaproteobacteria bacterium RIFCSPHIGHO2_12_FULL_42_100]OFW85751.1 MAG: xanthine phosphoribosyltransferase [Alphaproteobacteria bacterium RBG_16_42_14]OFW91543.1 MAG: xanthine phosphoribosyltra